MTPLEALLARVAELDKAATPGRWRAAAGKGFASVKGSDVAIYLNVRTVEVDSCVERWQRDADLIAEYRSAAPLLAKALEEILPVLRWHQPYPTDARMCLCSMRWPCDEAQALASIEALLGEAKP